MTRDQHRGQIVLLAAIALAVVLVPIVLAYLQLGYHADTEPTTGTAPETAVERALDRAVHNAASGIADIYEWDRRDEAIRTVQNRLDPPIQGLERSRLADGIVYRISYNQSRASQWVRANCDSGPDRQFGPCETSRGVVVQDRGDQTHVLAIALDITVSTPDGERRLTTVRYLA
ncbi:DUF7261 family protein [Halovenus amylolytica]|uniref:DUF7261 family protein n=1 Tax=Halovenus amylolytica TaxID=2500550 RepID=UPI00360A693D